jgi:hypothetical protein
MARLWHNLLLATIAGRCEFPAQTSMYYSINALCSLYVFTVYVHIYIFYIVIIMTGKNKK